MQISFDPTSCGAATLAAVLDLLYFFYPEQVEAHQFGARTPLTRVGSLSEHVHGLPSLTLTLTPSGPPDERSAASVFAGAAPLSDALLGAGATPLPNVPVVLPGSSVQQPAGLPGLALPGLPSGAQPANAPVASPAGGVELDKDGIPWHHEIHASTKSKTAKGVWTKLRGLNDEAKYNRIVAELKALHALPAGAPPATLPQGASAGAVIANMGSPAQHAAQVFAGTVGLTASPGPSGASAPLPAGLPPLQPLQTAAPVVPQNFDDMMPRITAAIAAGILPQDALETACTLRSLPGIVALVSRPDFVPVIWADIQGRHPALV